MFGLRLSRKLTWTWAWLTFDGNEFRVANTLNHIDEHWLCALFFSFSAFDVLNASLTLIEIQLFEEHPIYNEIIGIPLKRNSTRQMDKNSWISTFHYIFFRLQFEKNCQPVNFFVFFGLSKDLWMNDTFIKYLARWIVRRDVYFHIRRK